MANRCPTAAVAGASEIKDCRLLFRGAHAGAVATVEPFKGGRVPVLVWEITPADEAALDRYEGYPYLYRKEMVKVKLNGKTVSAMVYIMNVSDDDSKAYRPLGCPSAYYYSTIREGYEDAARAGLAGFDIDILRHATADSVEPEDTTVG
jgi:gamma-glutamylcyclotransferase (GGCT)/AIG2-like uncharacterized protein YtfP